ncbi:hypothetical protein niasHT_030982 [Heterodera trifolii]|uniref:RING-type E3 ubiquitin transferase n=1 Tax=Heterodera trifolii TaxID=157864 RepID=A0ABD2INB3_9BILA
MFACLLLGICCVAEEYSIELRVKPSLGRDQPHFYYAEVKCSSKEAFVPINAFFDPSPEDGYDLANFNVGNEKCPGGFQIGIAMFNGSYHEDFGWYTWGAKMPLLLKGIQFEENSFAMVQNIEFDNHFKLDISPKLADTSKLVYRVNVLCVDNNKLVFETFTQSDTIVVFNSIEGPNCGTYDVKVWPIFLDNLDEGKDETDTIQLPESKMFSTHGIAVGNDETHHIKYQSDETSAESECAICLDSYKHRESVVTLPCEHEFHTSCLNFWFKTKQNCPICRKEISVVPAKNRNTSNGSNAICANCSVRILNFAEDILDKFDELHLEN